MGCKGKGKPLAGRPHDEAGPEPDASDDEEDSEQEDADADDPPAFGSEASELLNDGEYEAGTFLSPFGPETFPTASACWAHAEASRGFSLGRLRAQFGPGQWTDYHRMRLINYLRSLGPEGALREAPGLAPSAALWADDRWLQPVLDDDMLLFEADDDGEEDEGVPPEEARPAAGAAEMAGGEAAALLASLAQEEELGRLREEVRSLRGLLSGGGGAGGRATGAEGALEADGLECSRRLPLARLAGSPSAAELFCEVVRAQPGSLDGCRVLNAGSGGGLLNILCLRLGAQSVVAVDHSVAALSAAKELAAANGFGDQVVLLRGSPGDARARGAGPSSEGAEGSFDALVSERLLGHPCYSPALASLLEARRQHLRTGGLLVPGGRATLAMVAVDCSAEPAAVLRCPVEPLGGLDLTALAPALGQLPRAELLGSLDPGQVASSAPATLLSLDLASAAPEKALPTRAPFRLQLRTGRCASALALQLRVELGAAAALGADTAAWCEAAPWTLLRLAGPGGAEPLLLPGSEFPEVEGHFSAELRGGCAGLDVAVELLARRGKRGADVRVEARFRLQ